MPNGMYNELLYHLDLCILAYHLYHQTLIWPMDPFYEQQARIGTSRRDNFMAEVHRRPFGTAFAGPGAFNRLRTEPPGAWHTNRFLDPIITDYSRVDPHIPSFFKPEKKWVYIEPQPFIQEEIHSVYRCVYTQEPDDAERGAHCSVSPIIEGDQTDRLYCFEGGTGGIETRHSSGGPKFTPHAWSMMGFALDRQRSDGPNDYDVHIAFRGSRSGWAIRAAAKGLVEKGNPDWVTDMDSMSGNPDPAISPKGNISMGFKRSIRSILPTLWKCLTEIQGKHGDVPPKTVFVTGHSLGGALATLCASALVIGNFRPADAADVLQNWPWNNVQLITFSAPTVGSADLANAINSSIYARRVHVHGDPITGDTIKGVHPGSEVELDGGFVKPNTAAHEPAKVRESLVKYLRALGIPAGPELPTALTSSPMSDFDTFEKLYSGKLQTDRNRVAAFLNHFDTYLKEYLISFKTIVSMSSSYLKPISSGEGATRAGKIQTLIAKLEPNAGLPLSDASANWNAAKLGEGTVDPPVAWNNLLALCIVLSGLSTPGNLPVPPDLINAMCGI